MDSINVNSGSGTEDEPYTGITLSPTVNKAYKFTVSDNTVEKTYNNVRLLYARDNEQYKSELATETSVTLSSDASVVFEFDDIPKNVAINKVELY